MRKKIDWHDDYPVLPIQEYDYFIMEVELVKDRIVISPIYKASSVGEANLISNAIKELEPKAKYYVKAEVRG